MQRFSSRIIVFIFLLVMLPQFLLGCSYSGKLHENFYKGYQSYHAKVPASATVIIEKNSLSKINTKGAVGSSYEIDLYVGLKKAVECAMANIFEKVIPSESISENNKVDFVVIPRFKAVVAYSEPNFGSQIYDAEMTISIEDYNDHLELATYQKTGRILYEHPPIIMITSFLWGFTLFTLTPIIMPINTRISGARRVDLFESFISQKIDEISGDIQRDENRLFAFRGQPHKEKIFPEEGEPKVKGNGSGFFITSDGYLLTNYHVISNATSIVIKTKKDFLPARIISFDKNNDIALLKAEGTFSSLPISASKNISLGSTIFTIGFPDVALLGFEPKFTKGEISSLFGIQDDPSRFQINAPIQPGNSGSPLVDLDGNVVGIIVATLNERYTLETGDYLPQNVNFAIKGSYILAFLENNEDIMPKLERPNINKMKYEELVEKVENSVVLVLIY